MEPLIPGLRISRVHSLFRDGSVALCPSLSISGEIQRVLASLKIIRRQLEYAETVSSLEQLLEMRLVNIITGHAATLQIATAAAAVQELESQADTNMHLQEKKDDVESRLRESRG